MIRKSLLLIAALALLPIAAPAQSVSPYTQHTFTQTDVTNGWKWPQPGGTIGQQSTCIIIVDSLTTNDVINVTGLSPHLSIVQPTLYTYGAQTAVTSLTQTGGFYFSCAGLTQIKFAPTLVGSTIEVAASNGVIARVPTTQALAIAQGASGADHLYLLQDPLSSTVLLDSGANSTLQPLNTNGSVTLGGGLALSADAPYSASFANTSVKWNSNILYTPNTAHFTAEAVIEPLSNPYGTGNCEVVVGNAAISNTFGHCSDSPGAYPGFGINFGDHVNGCHVSNGSTFAIAQLPVLASGSLYLLDCVFTGTQVQMYVNGVLFSTAAFSGSYSNGGGTFFVGGDSLSGNLSYTGLIANVAMYQTALSPAQIANHFNALTVGSPIQSFAKLSAGIVNAQQVLSPGLTPGNCVQAAAGGLLTTIASACGLPSTLPTCSGSVQLCKIQGSCSVTAATSCTWTFNISNSNTRCASGWDTRNTTVAFSTLGAIGINGNGNMTVTLGLNSAQTGTLAANIVCGGS